MASTLLSTDECRSAVAASLNTSDFDIAAVNVVPRSNDLLGFMGEHWTVYVDVSLRNDEAVARQTKQTFFAKSVPRRMAAQTEYVMSTRAFEKETGVYNKVLGIFSQILTTPTEHHVASAEERERQPVSCHCYFTRPDLLILEDLSLFGFTTISSRIPMDLAHCSAVLRTLARFHAASIIFEEQRRRRSEPICSINQLYDGLLAESLFCGKDTPAKDWFIKSIDVVVAVAKLLAKYQDPKCHRLIKEKIPVQYLELWEQVKPSGTYRNVLCHGDIWSSNILFSYEEDDSEHKTPTGVRLIDFQLARYAPPAHDLMMFLYLTTTRAIREIHEQDLLRLYHGALGAELACHGLDCEQLLPWSELQESCREQRLAALVITTAYFPSILGDSSDNILESPEKYADFVYGDRTTIVMRKLSADPVFRERMTQTVEELVECVLSC